MLLKQFLKDNEQDKIIDNFQELIKNYPNLIKKFLELKNNSVSLKRDFDLLLGGGVSKTLENYWKDFFIEIDRAIKNLNWYYKSYKNFLNRDAIKLRADGEVWKEIKSLENYKNYRGWTLGFGKLYDETIKVASQKGFNIEKTNLIKIYEQVNEVEDISKNLTIQLLDIFNNIVHLFNKL